MEENPVFLFGLISKVIESFIETLKCLFKLDALKEIVLFDGEGLHFAVADFITHRRSADSMQ